MKDKNMYLALELILTFFLIAFAVLLPQGGLSILFKASILAGLAAGLSFSWKASVKSLQWAGILVNASGIVILAWMVNAVFRLSFFYQEFFSIIFKATFFLEVALSFIACEGKFLGLIQALSLPLFMRHALFVEKDPLPVILLCAGYFIVWLCILRIKFYRSIGPQRQKGQYWTKSAYLAFVFFVMSLLAAWIISQWHPVNATIAQGSYSGSGPWPEPSSDNLEHEFYDTQDKLIKEMTELIPSLNTAEEKAEVLELTNKLINDFKYMMEVSSALDGLLSKSKTRGLGLEKGPQDYPILLVNQYVDKKPSVYLRKTRERIREGLENSDAGVLKSLSTLFKVSKLIYSNSVQGSAGAIEQIAKSIEGLSISQKGKDDLKEAVGDLKYWKAFELYRSRLNHLDKSIPAGGLKDLVTDIDRAAQPSDIRGIQSRVKDMVGLDPAFSGRQENQARELLDLKAELLALEEIARLKDKLEKADLPRQALKELKDQIDSVSATADNRALSRDSARLEKNIAESTPGAVPQIKQLVSLKKEALSEARKIRDYQAAQSKAAELKKQEQRSRAKVHLKKVVSRIILIVLGVIILAVCLLRFFVEKKKARLLARLKDDPREFIVGLYENAKSAIMCFEHAPAGVIPPLEYAGRVQGKYQIPDGLFVNFTARFQEARYSGHGFHPDDAISELDCYNDFLKVMLSRLRFLQRLSAHCRALFMGIPFFIRKKQ